MKMPWEFSEGREARIAPMMPRKAARFIFNFGGQCYYCERPVEYDTQRHARHPTRDHKTPKTRGGDNGKDNVTLACVACNHVKADMTEEEFRFFIANGRLAQSYVEYLTEKFAELCSSLTCSPCPAV